MFRIGIDLGGTNIAAGLVNEEYKIIRKMSTPTRAKTRTAEELADAMAGLCQELVAAEGLAMADIDAIGIASPGVANSVEGTVSYCSNIPAFRHAPIVAMLRERTGAHAVHVENDANAAAWAEHVAGAARGTQNSVTITLGTGVGGGVIIEGKVFSGSNFAGAELGHIVIEKNGVPCTCGRRGCWEAYSSATGLIRMTKEKLAECEREGRATLMTAMVAERGKVSGRHAFQAMHQGDAAGKEVVDEYLSYLATGIVNIIDVFQPEVICIGGGVSNERDALIEPMLPTIVKEQYGSGYVFPTRICVAELGNDAGIIGAAFLGI